MLSMSIQSSINGTFTCPSFPSPNPSFKPLKTSIPMKHSVFSLHSSTILELRDRPIKRIQRLSASATTEAVTEESSSESPTPATSQDSEPSEEAEKLEVVVKSVSKPRLVLKFIWMEKNIGLALDQVIPGHGTIPLSPYHFWPRKDAWEELKSTLESKPWISQKKMIILLNQATDIINLWQQSGGNLS